MRILLLKILLPLVTFFSVTAHSHIMENGSEFDSAIFFDESDLMAVSDFECTEIFDEDNYVFCEEGAPTRRPEVYKRHISEYSAIINQPKTERQVAASTIHSFPGYSDIQIRPDSYSFIVRLTPF